MNEARILSEAGPSALVTGIKTIIYRALKTIKSHRSCFALHE